MEYTYTDGNLTKVLRKDTSTTTPSAMSYAFTYDAFGNTLTAKVGGRLVFLLVELIFRRPIPPKYEGWVHAGGLALLLALMAVVTFNDILRIIKG